MVGGESSAERFGSTEHLASEVVAAFVDGELRMNAYLRAAQHLAKCPECAAEVDAQQQARGMLRSAAAVAMPTTLLGALTQIPGLPENCVSKLEMPALNRRRPLRWWK